MSPNSTLWSVFIGKCSLQCFLIEKQCALCSLHLSVHFCSTMDVTGGAGSDISRRKPTDRPNCCHTTLAHNTAHMHTSWSAALHCNALQCIAVNQLVQWIAQWVVSTLGCSCSKMGKEKNCKASKNKLVDAQYKISLSQPCQTYLLFLPGVCHLQSASALSAVHWLPIRRLLYDWWWYCIVLCTWYCEVLHGWGC